MRLAVESELATPRSQPEEVLADLDRLESTISTLLVVARDLPRTYEPLDPEVAATRLHERWAQRLARTGRDLMATGNGDGPYGSAPRCSTRSSTSSSTTPGATGCETVRVAIDAAGGSLLSVSVADEGSTTVEGAAMFQRRPPGTDRHGLGLALARSLAEAEGAAFC